MESSTLKTSVLKSLVCIFFASSLVGGILQADDYPLYRSYPRVYGPTHRLYGPTQAGYQYQRQYGHPSYGYGAGASSTYFNNYYTGYSPFYFSSGNLNYGYQSFGQPNYRYTNYGMTSANYYPYGGFHPTGRFSTYIPLIGYSGTSYFSRPIHYHSYSPYRYGYSTGYGINRYLPLSVYYSNGLYSGAYRYASPQCYYNNYSGYHNNPTGYDLNNLGVNYPQQNQNYPTTYVTGSSVTNINYGGVTLPAAPPAIYYPVVDPVVYDVIRQHEVGRQEAQQSRPVEVVVRKFANKSSTEDKIRSLNYQLQGDTYLKQGEYPKAILKYEIAQAAAGDRAEPYFHMAVAQIGQREYTSALQSVRNGLEVDPLWVEKKETLTSIFGEQNPESVRMLTSQLADWVQQNPSDKSRLELQGFVLLMEGNEELSQQYFDVAKQLGGMEGTLATLRKLKSSVVSNDQAIPLNSTQEIVKQSIPNASQASAGLFPMNGNEVRISAPVIPPLPVTESLVPEPEKEFRGVQFPESANKQPELPRFPAESTLESSTDSPLTDPPPQ